MEKNDNKKKESFFPYKVTNNTFGRIYADANSFLNSFDSAIQNIYPLNSKQTQYLPKNINELSHKLTDERSDRRLGYMNNQVNLLSYAHYFQWWNLYKFTSLFASFSTKSFYFLKNNSVLLDIGSGPLTIPIALWLSRPELRNLNLTFYVLDISQTAMKLGEELFLSAAAACPAPNSSDPWKIIRVKGELGTEIRQKVSLITCGNMFNELIQNSAKSLESLDYFVKNDFSIISPCPHYEICPMCSAKSKKWCHFTLDAKYAPQKLLTLSSKALLPKENVTLSFTFVSNFHKPVEKDFLTLRIFSDIIKLPDNQFGKYACSTLGLILVTGSSTRKLKSGTELVINISQASAKTLLRDKKSGAYILNIN